MTTTRAWLLMQHAVATGCARHAPAPAAAPDSTLHPRARGVIEGPQRDPRGNALAGDLHFVSACGDPLGTHRCAAVGEVAETERRTDGMTEHPRGDASRSEEHTSELQSHSDLVCRLLLEKKKKKNYKQHVSNLYIAERPSTATEHQA